MSRRAPFPFPRKLQPYAEAIGGVCLQWAFLETAFDGLLMTLLDMVNVSEFETVAHNVDFRDKMQIVLGLGFLKRPSERAFGILKWCVDYTDNELRVRRNRYVHDHWYLVPDAREHLTARQQIERSRVESHTRKTGFYKPQARKIDYYTKIIGKETPKQIISLCDEMSAMGMRYSLLRWAYEGALGDLAHIQEFAPLPLQEAEKVALLPADAIPTPRHPPLSSRTKSR